MYNNHLANPSFNGNAPVARSTRSPSPSSITVSPAMAGGSPIKSHSVAGGRINITAFSPDVGAMPNNKIERLSQFKAAIRTADRDDIVMGPEYFFNKQAPKGLSPCTLQERDDVVESLADESGRSLNRNKTIVIGMVWQDPRSGKLHNTVDVFRNGEHILAHNKKTTDQYDAVHFPARHGWYEGSSDHAELCIAGQKVWLTTGSDNAECSAHNRNLPEHDKPDVVLIPTSGLGAPDARVGKAGASSIVCDADGHSREVKTPQATVGFTTHNIMSALLQNESARKVLSDAGISERTGLMGLKRDVDLQDNIAAAIVSMINSRQAVRENFSALEATGLFGAVMELVDNKLESNYRATPYQIPSLYLRYSGN